MTITTVTEHWYISDDTIDIAKVTELAIRHSSRCTQIVHHHPKGESCDIHEHQLYGESVAVA